MKERTTNSTVKSQYNSMCVYVLVRSTEFKPLIHVFRSSGLKDNTHTTNSHKKLAVLCQYFEKITITQHTHAPGLYVYFLSYLRCRINKILHLVHKLIMILRYILTSSALAPNTLKTNSFHKLLV